MATEYKPSWVYKAAISGPDLHGLCSQEFLRDTRALSSKNRAPRVYHAHFLFGNRAVL